MLVSELRTRLGGELERLSQELTMRLSAEITAGPERTDSAPGAKLEEIVKRRIRLLGQLVAGLASVEVTTIWPDRAGYGSTVRLRDRASGEERSCTLMTGDFIDIDAGQVSLASPIGNALLGRMAGEEVTVVMPRGERRYEILEVLTLPERLGLAPGEEEATLQVA